MTDSKKMNMKMTLKCVITKVIPVEITNILTSTDKGSGAGRQGQIPALPLTGYWL